MISIILKIPNHNLIPKHSKFERKREKVWALGLEFWIRSNSTCRYDVSSAANNHNASKSLFTRKRNKAMARTRSVTESD
jgi:hypothetical protein